MQWILDVDGGFVVRFDAGNYSYAYPTSMFANQAVKHPERTAIAMAKAADDGAHLPTIARYNEYMSRYMIDADKRIHDIL